MLRLLCLSIVCFVTTGAQDAAATGPRRCTDLVAFFDRWASSRSEHSDGARNHARIRATIECERGDHPAGIARIEALLVERKFEVPVEVGEPPLYYPSGDVAELPADR
jgi:hypothetical protein